MRARKSLLIVAQIALVGVLLWLAWRSVNKHPGELSAAWSRVHLRADLLLLSGAIVFASYAILIEMWRRVTMAWGGHLAYGDAARIWFIANLGKYVPGKVWSIAAMGALSQRAGVPAAAAVASSVYIQVIYIVAGVAVTFLCAPNVFPVPGVLPIAGGIAAAVFVFVPSAIPRTVAWVAKRFGRTFELAPLPYSTIALAFAISVAGWLLQGLAFYVLALGTLGDSSVGLLNYIALYSGSYLLGFLAIFAAGGIGMRESAMVIAAPRYGFTSADASVFAIASRVWLTVLELVPGLFFLLTSKRERTIPPTADEVRTS